VGERNEFQLVGWCQLACAKRLKPRRVGFFHNSVFGCDWADSLAERIQMKKLKQLPGYNK
jgi:hypothetical protein